MPFGVQVGHGRDCVVLMVGYDSDGVMTPDEAEALGMRLIAQAAFARMPDEDE